MEVPPTEIQEETPKTPPTTIKTIKSKPVVQAPKEWPRAPEENPEEPVSLTPHTTSSSGTDIPRPKKAKSVEQTSDLVSKEEAAAMVDFNHDGFPPVQALAMAKRLMATKAAGLKPEEETPTIKSVPSSTPQSQATLTQNTHGIAPQNLIPWLITAASTAAAFAFVLHVYGVKVF